MSINRKRLGLLLSLLMTFCPLYLIANSEWKSHVKGEETGMATSAKIINLTKEYELLLGSAAKLVLEDREILKENVLLPPETVRDTIEPSSSYQHKFFRCELHGPTGIYFRKVDSCEWSPHSIDLLGQDQLYTWYDEFNIEVKAIPVKFLASVLENNYDSYYFGPKEKNYTLTAYSYIITVTDKPTENAEL